MTTMTYRPRSGAERTRDAVLGWARALPAERYLITAVPAGPEAGSVAHKRFLTVADLERALPWLAHLNSAGHHIVGRPWATQHVLVDDLTASSLDGLARWCPPAAVVESSPGSLQAWITIADEPVEPAHADAVARHLATRFGGDRFAARASQSGRVPGYTCRKKKRFNPQRGYPFALLRSARGPFVEPAAAALLEEVRATRRQVTGVVPGPRPDTHRPTLLRLGDPTDEHAEAVAHLAATLPPGTPIDRSRADYAIALRLLARGLSVSEAVSVVLAGDKARCLGTATAETYARRTVEAARNAMERRPQAWGPPV
ncbi:DNA-primase RepB domain-containing protein [Roseomonas sp. GCM10028921]